MDHHRADMTAPTDTQDVQALEVARRIGELLAEQGIPTHQQASLLTQLCGLSLSQARRKLHGASWSFSEVLAVVRHFGVSLDRLFPVDGSSTLVAENQTMLEGTFLTQSAALPCRIRLGARLVGKVGRYDLVARQGEEGWTAGLADQIGSTDNEPLFHANEVVLLPVAKPAVRVAILDDDPAASEALAEWFSAAGYAASTFTSCEQLTASGLANHNAFIVDFVLADDDSAQHAIADIRQQLPEAPVFLLTGKLRDGAVSEADLTAVLRTTNVTFFEKPVRPSVLAAALQSSLDQLALRSSLNK